LRLVLAACVARLLLGRQDNASWRGTRLERWLVRAAWQDISTGSVLFSDTTLPHYLAAYYQPACRAPAAFGCVSDQDTISICLACVISGPSDYRTRRDACSVVATSVHRRGPGLRQVSPFSLRTLRVITGGRVLPLAGQTGNLPSCAPGCGLPGLACSATTCRASCSTLVRFCGVPRPVRRLFPANAACGCLLLACARTSLLAR